MKQFVLDTPQQGADVVVDAILSLLAEKPNALLCLAAGHSSLPVFEGLLAAQRAGRADFTRARFVGLDEWLGVTPACEGACCNFLQRSLFTPLGITPAQLCLFDPLCTDPAAECARVEQYISACGGIDFMLLGMGMNGHLALNEPGDSFENGAHVAPLSDTTKSVAPKYFTADMPPLTHGITLGIRNLLAAHCIYLTIFGAHKKAVVQTLLHSERTEAFPASVLLAAPQANLVLDRAALPDA